MNRLLSVGRDLTTEQALAECAWSPNPAPPAFCSAAFDPAFGLSFHLRSLASPTRALNTLPDSSVWEDSCLECFFSFDGQNYVNLEANANGALRASFGPDRHRRRFIREMDIPQPYAEACLRDGSWEIFFRVPVGTIEALFAVTPGSGTLFRGNFYSCGDLTPQPHYASWNPVETASPDFHRPEYFGLLRIK
ncbi:MAG: hypothetical protein K6C08_01980 [Oscillospiraceae bacterium]|nr:hypothetical protein [Oscillospiraceae bacterium]